MLCSNVCTLAFVLASMIFLIPTLVLASDLQVENEHSFDPSELGLRDDQSITKSSSLQGRDMDKARTTDLTSLRGQTPIAAFKRSGKSAYSHVRSVSRSEAGYIHSLSERSLFTDLSGTVFRLVWDYMDITFAAYVDFYQTRELWANMTANARGKWKAEDEVMLLNIRYGGLKLSIASVIDVISWELVAKVAAELLVLSRIIAFGTFRLFVFANLAAMVITLAIAEGFLRILKPELLVTGP